MGCIFMSLFCRAMVIMPCPEARGTWSCSNMRFTSFLFSPSAGRCFPTACLHFHLTLVGVLATGQLSVVTGCLGELAGLGASCTAAAELQVVIEQSESLGLRVVRLWDSEATVSGLFPDFVKQLPNTFLLSCCLWQLTPLFCWFSTAGVIPGVESGSQHSLLLSWLQPPATQWGFQEQSFLLCVVDELWCQNHSPEIPLSASHYESRYLWIIFVQKKITPVYYSDCFLRMSD